MVYSITFKIFLSFLVKLVLDLPLMLLGYLVFPIAYLFEKDNHLPIWAWFWDNKDHGIDGESFWAKRTVGWSRFHRCFWWSVVRNPTFNWSKYVLGFTSNGGAKRIAGTQATIGDKKAEGWYFAVEGPVWEFYYIKAYSVFGKRKCIRLRCGWKLDGKKFGEVAQFCFAPSLAMTYEGK